MELLETGAIVGAVERLSAAERLTVSPSNGTSPDAEILVVPGGKTVVNLKPYLEAFALRPERRKGVAVVRSQRTLVSLTTRHRHEGTTVIFANPDRAKPSLVTVFDYHPQTDDVDDAEWCQHRARYECELSEEWKAWSGAHGAVKDQRQFAEFVEDHLADVIVPPTDDEKLAELAKLMGGRFTLPADLVGLSRGLQVSSEVKVREAVTLSSGEIAVTYDEQHRDGAGKPLQIANLFVIAIPVFYAGPLYRIPVRLRYTLREGGIKWSVHLYRHDRVFDHAFDEICQAVGLETGAPVYIGRPE